MCKLFTDECTSSQIALFKCIITGHFNSFSIWTPNFTSFQIYLHKQLISFLTHPFYGIKVMILPIFKTICFRLLLPWEFICELGVFFFLFMWPSFNDYYKIEIIFFSMLSRTSCLFLKQASLLNAWLASVS